MDDGGDYIWEESVMHALPPPSVGSCCGRHRSNLKSFLPLMKSQQVGGGCYLYVRAVASRQQRQHFCKGIPGRTLMADPDRSYLTFLVGKARRRRGSLQCFELEDFESLGIDTLATTNISTQCPGNNQSIQIESVKNRFNFDRGRAGSQYHDKASIWQPNYHHS